MCGETAARTAGSARRLRTRELVVARRVARSEASRARAPLGRRLSRVRSCGAGGRGHCRDAALRSIMDGTRVLTFDVCGGLTNQRISIVQGLLIGHITRRAVTLPLLNANGVQRPDQGYTENRSNMVPFDTFFERNATTTALEALGIRIVPHRSAMGEDQHNPKRRVHATARKASWYGQQFRGSRGPPVLRLDCTFAAIDNAGRDGSKVFSR